MSIATLLLSTLSWGWPLAKPAPPTEAILAEGLHLYQSERSSWVATDLMMATTIDRTQIGGYLSYLDGDSVRTIFWPKGTAGTAGTPLLASYSFLRQDVRVETGNYRPAGQFTAHEARLFAIRQAAQATLAASPTEYPIPANTSLNLAILEDGTDMRVYVLTGPTKAGIVPIGNDHLLTFSADGRLKSTERLHNSYLAMGPGASKTEVNLMFHSHLEAHPYITPSDICSTLLYRHQVPAHQHYVIGREYVSIFDIDKQILAIMTRKAFDKIKGSK
jgi:hypothetical protein